MSTDQWDATLYDRSHAFVNRLGEDVLKLLAPKPGEFVLDLGCGTGPLTRKIAEAGAQVVGIDASPAMIARARASYPSLAFQVMDATVMEFEQPFDAIFSNAALHWIKPPEAAAKRMFTAVKPGGRLVLEMGGKENVSAILAAAVEAGDFLGLDLRSVLHINYFPSVSEYAAVLENAGFEVSFAVLFDRQTPLENGEAGLRNWIQMFRPGVISAVPEHVRNVFFDSIERICRSRLWSNGMWKADYRRLRIKALRS